MLRGVRATTAERHAAMAGDIIVPDAVVTMDRAFTLGSTPEAVFPWVVQLGKQRAGWYLPRWLEQLIPPSRRAIRHVDPQWQTLRVGDVIPDYGGRHETFTVVVIEPPSTLVYESWRRHTQISWAISLTPTDGGRSTRVRLRLRAGPVKHRWLMAGVGELLDSLTIAAMASGLCERLADARLEPDDS